MQEREYQVVNGTRIDVTTIFNKTVQYIPTDEEVEKVKEGYRVHCDEFFPGRLVDETGLDVMFNKNGEFWKQKGWLVAAMKRHPDYNGNLQIVLKNTPMRRYIDRDSALTFFRFCFNKVDSVYVYFDRNGNEITKEKANQLRDYYRSLKNRTEELYTRVNSTFRREKLSNLYGKFRELLDDVSTPRNKYGKELDVLDEVKRFFYRVKSQEAQFVDEDLARAVCVRMRDDNYCRAGQKVSRLVGKIGKAMDLHKIVDIKEIPYVDQDGIPHTRTKDMGWNYQYAMFCDAINPLEIDATAVISVNPVDFLRMSFGYKWASCMTTDKENRRHAQNNYHGMYCGGAMSYCNDSSTFIVYFIPQEGNLPKDYKVNEWFKNGVIDPTNQEGPEWLDKLKRCNFHIGEDKIVQGRVYPDGRDGGEESLSGDMRALVQRVLSQIFDFPNYWDLSKGTSVCGEVTNSIGTHYKDYLCYDDCTVSFAKRIDGFKNVKRIRIGHVGICPECGREHYNEENIFCECCSEQGYICEHCGCHIDEDDVIYIDGETYCRDCVEWCEPCGEYHLSDDMTETYEGDRVCDECLERYYVYCRDVRAYVYEDNVIQTEEGDCYCVDSELNSDGYACCSRCGELHNMENMHYDEETGEYYCDECYEELLAEREDDDDSERVS